MCSSFINREEYHIIHTIEVPIGLGNLYMIPLNRRLKIVHNI